MLIVPFYTVMFSDRGLTPSQIGIALAAWSATGLVLEIPMGILADRFSRRWLLFAGQTVRALGFVVWLLVPSFWGFLLGFVLWGVKTATQSGTFEALVYDEVTAQDRQDEYVRVIARAQSARFTGVLTASLLARLRAILPEHDGPWIIYGEACRLGAARLAATSVTFKQTPYDVKAR